MMLANEKRAAGHFRPQSLPPKESGDKITPFFKADISTRLDTLAFDPEVTGLVHVTDGYLSILELPRVTSSDSERTVSGVIGSPGSYHAYSSLAKLALANFVSWEYMVNGGPECGDLVIMGPSMREYLTEKCDVSTEFIPLISGRRADNTLLPDSEVDIGCITIPVCIPLCHDEWVLEGEIGDADVQESLLRLSSLAGLWGECIKEKRGFSAALGNDKKFRPHFKNVLPSGTHTPKLDPNLSVKTLRTGLIKNQLDGAVDNIYQSNRAAFFLENLDLDPQNTVSRSDHSPPASIVTTTTPTPFSQGPPPTQASVPEKFTKFIALVKLLFATATFDAAGDIIALTPALLTEDLKEALESSSSTKDLSRTIINCFTHMVSAEVKQSRDFLFKAVDPPLINHALIGFFISAIFPTISVNKSTEAMRSTFNMYPWAPPPRQHSSDYLAHLRSTSDNIADHALDQPEHKMAAVQRKTFVGGRQDSLHDVVSTIGNFFAFAKCLVNFDMSDTSTYPLILHRMADFADILQDPSFVLLHDTAILRSPWMPHQLITLLQNYFHSTTLVATTPAFVRNIIAHGVIKDSAFKNSEFIMSKMMDNLQSCVALGNIGFLSAHQPNTYLLFFPQASATSSKRERDDTTTTPPRPKSQKTSSYEAPPTSTSSSRTGGFLSNSSRERVFPPFNKLTCSPCMHYLEDGKCGFQAKCKHDHFVFPKDYNKADRIVMSKWVHDTACLSWKPSAKQALARLEASK